MKVHDFVLMAKKAQSSLKTMGMPAEHIYLVGYSDPKSIPSLVFVSSKYDSLDIYRRSQLASAIQQSPLKFNFYVIGADHILEAKWTLSRDQLYRAIKLYGTQPLLLNGFEYASKSDMELVSQTSEELSI
jgi:hypothetical protein